MDAAMLPSILCMRSAYGRAASAAACARRSLEAATICMALVIFCVALVAAMRTRMSLRLAIFLRLYPLSCPAFCRASRLGGHHGPLIGMAGASPAMTPIESSERLGIAVDHALEPARVGVRQVAALADAVEQIRVLGTQQRQQS